MQETEPKKPEPKEPVQLADYPGAPFEARNGHLWFGTVQEGLIRYDGTEFVTFTTKDGLPGMSIRGLVEDEAGLLWVGTTGGVCTFDGKRFTALTNYKDTTATRTLGNQRDHLDIWEILHDSQGQCWIATLGGVFRYDGAAFVPFALPVIAAPGAFEFAPKMVYHIYEDKAGDIWFGTDGAGAVRYDGKTMKVYTAESHGLCSDRICTILQDRRGDYWFGTSDGGTSRFDGSAFTTHMRSATRSPHTGWGRCMSILEDREGNVWFGVASAGGGVHRYDGKTFRYFGTKDGLGNGGIPSIRQDRSGTLWFGTTAGVYKLEGERFVNVTKDQ